LVSGRGSNLQAILDAIENRSLDAKVELVISNKPGAPALARAQAAGVETCVISHKDFDGREAFDAALAEKLLAHGVEWVVLAGFMRVLTPVFIQRMQGRIINIHPALLPSFPGVHAQQQALDYGVKITGPIIAQRAVEVRDGDDDDSLSARILVQEHDLMVTVLRGISDGSIVPPLGKRRTLQG
jgi:phosphoribosylglycinamide formyltransferase-1